jgi:hypothetical protein
MVFVTKVPWLLSLSEHQKCFNLWIFHTFYILVCIFGLGTVRLFYVALFSIQNTCINVHMCILNLFYYNLNVRVLFQINEAVITTLKLRRSSFLLQEFSLNERL